MELWLILAILAYMFYALATSIDKYLMNHNYKATVTSAIRLFFDGVVLLTVGVIFYNLSIPLSLIGLGFVLGFLYATSVLLYFKSLCLGDAEEFVPSYQAFSILFVFIASTIFLGEQPIFMNYLGIGVLIIGVYFVLAGDNFQPPKMNKFLMFILMMVALDTIYALFVKKYVAIYQPINMGIVMYFSAALVLFSYELFFKHERVPIFVKKNLKIIPASIFGAFGTLSLYGALAVGNATKVYPIAGIESVFMFILATMFLKEKFNYKKLFGILIVFVGIYLVAT